MDGGFAAACRSYCIHEALKLLLIPQLFPLEKLILSGLVIALFARPSPRILVLAIGLRCCHTLALMPIIWDSFYWCLQIDGAGLLLCVSLTWLHGSAEPGQVAWWWASIARHQLSIFYTACAFWKLNTSFLEARTSCSTIFVLTLLQLTGVDPPTELAPLLARLSPGITIVGEGAIGLLLAAPSRKLVRLGTALALLLHMGIALTPAPNNATPFSLTCVVRLMIAHAPDVSLAFNELAGLQHQVPGRVTAGVAIGAAASLTWMAYLRACRFPPNPLPAAPDFWITATTALSVICLRALLLQSDRDEGANGMAAAGNGTRGGEGARGGNGDGGRPGKPGKQAAPATKIRSVGAGDAAAETAVPASTTSSTTPSTTYLSRLRSALIGLAVVYAFGGPLIGFQDLGACNMYSNLRMHGGSNHLLVPTNIAGRMHAGGGPTQTEN